MLGVSGFRRVSVAAYAAVIMTAVFLIIKKTVGLRVSKEEDVSDWTFASTGL
jgi:Amt family ammonium transporter